MRNLKQKIFEMLDQRPFLTDTEVVKIYSNKEPNWATIEEYKRQWKARQRDRNFFNDKNIVKLINYRGIRTAELDTGYCYRICKDFFDEIKKDFKKDTSRPDLNIEMYVI